MILMGGGTDGLVVSPQSIEDIQMVCVHVWRDTSELSGVITQECIRCKKSRSLTI